MAVPAALIEAKKRLGQDVSMYYRDETGVWRVRDASSSNVANENRSLPRFSFSSFSIPWRGIGVIALIAGSISAAVAGGMYFLMPHQVQFKITQLPWQVDVRVESYQPVQKSGWKDEVPANARNVSAGETRQRGEKQDGTKPEKYMEPYTVKEAQSVPDGQDCKMTNTGKGVGESKCSPKFKTIPAQTATRPAVRQVPNMVPKYDIYKTWEVNEWTYFQTFTSNGRDDQPRVAPRVTLDNFPYPERALPATESCSITGLYIFENQQKVGTFSIPCAEFDLVDEGQEIPLSITRAGTSHLILPAKK